MRSLTRWVALPCVLFALAGCVTTTAGGSGEAAVAPALSVERFLQAANQQDLDTMARIFGTYDGPVGDTGSTLGCAFKKMGSWIGLSDACINRMDVELRMNTIALILRHDDYEIGQDQTVPGRQHPTSMVPVTLVQGQNRIQGIPFTVVRSGSGRWLIEQIDLERVTRVR